MLCSQYIRVIYKCTKLQGTELTSLPPHLVHRHTSLRWPPTISCHHHGRHRDSPCSGGGGDCWLWLCRLRLWRLRLTHCTEDINQLASTLYASRTTMAVYYGQIYINEAEGGQCLTGFGSLVVASRTAAVLAIRVAVRVLRGILIAIAVAIFALSQLYDLDVLDGRVVAILAAEPAALLRRPVLDALAQVTLAALNALDVLHLPRVSLCQ